MSTERLQKAKINMSGALSALQTFLSQAQDRDLDRSGVIKAFEFTYETSWKFLQKLADHEGLQANSPREAIKFGFRRGLIQTSDEKWWLQMIEDRNLTVHTYDVDLAKEIFSRIKGQYLTAFLNLQQLIEKTGF